jgi:uncharacterized protein
MNIRRREILSGSILASVSLMSGCVSLSAGPSLKQLAILSAGQGSAFLPYAQGVAAYLSANGMKAAALESTGSIENIRRLSTEPEHVATVFLGTAFEGMTGTASWTQGAKFTNIRALVPMYETSFQIVAPRSSGLFSVSQLSGKRVGVGPAGGPAENYFKALTEIAGVTPQLVTGTPNALAADLLIGKIDALWQGAVVPIPAIKQVADSVDAVVFGLSDKEQIEMLSRFPILAASAVSANVYRGQTRETKSVAAWNCLMAHRDLPDADAYWITRTLLEAKDPEVRIHPTAKSKRAENGVTNRVIPFHPGAARYYRERGIAVV